MIFSKFTPVESKLKILVQKLMDEPLYITDEFRDYKILWKIIADNFIMPNTNEYYEMGDFGGLVGFVNIVPSHKAEMVFKIWDKSLWGLGFAKQLKKLIKYTMINHDLKRIVTESADRRVVKFAKILGFKVEGRFKYGFKWNDELYTLYRIRILREEVQ